MQNLEIKLECRDPGLARAICVSYGATFIGVLDQTDTYSRLPQGRLKKRECPGEPTEFIFYERADAARPRMSRFTIYSEREAETRFGRNPLPVWVVVKKRRELFIAGNVRIHLDSVEGLGDFVEFEALVSGDHSAAKCHAAIAALREALAPVLGEPISLGYSDLLARGTDGGESAA